MHRVWADAAASYSLFFPPPAQVVVRRPLRHFQDIIHDMHEHRSKRLPAYMQLIHAAHTCDFCSAKLVLPAVSGSATGMRLQATPAFFTLQASAGCDQQVDLTSAGSLRIEQMLCRPQTTLLAWRPCCASTVALSCVACSARRAGCAGGGARPGGPPRSSP